MHPSIKKLDIRNNDALPRLIMANTFSQICIQLVFATQGRQNLIRKDYKEELQKYIGGVVAGQNQKLLAIHCMPDTHPP